MRVSKRNMSTPLSPSEFDTYKKSKAKTKAKTNVKTGKVTVDGKSIKTMTKTKKY